MRASSSTTGPRAVLMSRAAKSTATRLKLYGMTERDTLFNRERSCGVLPAAHAPVGFMARNASAPTRPTVASTSGACTETISERLHSSCNVGTSCTGATMPCLVTSIATSSSLSIGSYTRYFCPKCCQQVHDYRRVSAATRLRLYINDTVTLCSTGKEAAGFLLRLTHLELSEHHAWDLSEADEP